MIATLSTRAAAGTAGGSHPGAIAPPADTVRTYALTVVSIAAPAPDVVWQVKARLESPHFSADGGALFFNREGRIYRLILGSGQPPVAIDTGFATHCNNDHGLSPDGTQLVISDLTETGKSLMYVLPVGGGAPTRVDVSAPAYWHGWSPDGRTLAYCAARNGEYDIYTVPVAGGKETRLTRAPGNDNGPDYSADGRWIYFHSERTGRMQVWRMQPGRLRAGAGDPRRFLQLVSSSVAGRQMDRRPLVPRHTGYGPPAGR